MQGSRERDHSSPVAAGPVSLVALRSSLRKLPGSGSPQHGSAYVVWWWRNNADSSGLDSEIRLPKNRVHVFILSMKAMRKFLRTYCC